MTACFMFRIKTKDAPSLIRGMVLTAIDMKMDVDVLEKDNWIECYLNYAYGNPEEIKWIKNAVSILSSVSTEKVVYVPCSEAFDKFTKMSDSEITVQEIFEKHYPTLSTETNHMYALANG